IASNPFWRPLGRRLAVVLTVALALLPGARADVLPAVAKKLAKLELKLASKQAKLAAAQSDLGAAQAALLAAQLQLLQAQDLPTGTPEELAAQVKAVKAATKVSKKATTKVSKLDAKVDKLQAQIADLMADIEALDPGHFDDQGGDGGGDGGDGGGGGSDPTGGNPLDPAASHPLRAIGCGAFDGYATPEAGWELLSETESPAGVSLSPAPLDTVHVAQFFPVAKQVAFPSSVATLDPDQLGQRRLFTSLQLADPTTLSVG